MSEADFFRQPLAEMIDPRHPLAVLAGRLPWAQIEAALAPRFARQVREGRLPCDATQIGRFRSAIGEAGVQELLKATIDTAVASKAIRPAEFERLIVDTTVQEKAIAHPVDSRLLEIARHKVVAAAKRAGIALKQTFAREGKSLRRRAGGYGLMVGARSFTGNRTMATRCTSSWSRPPS